MKRGLPSDSSHKRKRQDAFGDASAFTTTAGQGVVDGRTGEKDPTFKDAIKKGAINNDTSSGAVPTRVPKGSVPLRNPTASKPHGIMAFSPMSRLDRTSGPIGAPPQTPSRMPRLASPGLPVPTGFTLPPAPGNPRPVRAPPGSIARRGATPSKSSIGMSPLQSIMTPLSGLKAIGGDSKTGLQSPSANLAKTSTLQSINDSGPSSGNPAGLISKRITPQDRPIQGGLPTMPSFRALVNSDDARYPSVEPESALFAEAFLTQDSSRNKGRQNDDKNSLTRYLNRLVSKQQAASSLFIANLSLSRSRQIFRNKLPSTEAEDVSGSVAAKEAATVFSTADIVVVVQSPLLPVQHASPIFQCRVSSTVSNRSVGFHSINPSDSLLVSFSGNTGSQASMKNLQGHIDPCRLAATMKQIQMHNDPDHVPKQILAGIWEPWQEVTLGNDDGAGIPRVVLLCSRFVIMEA